MIEAILRGLMYLIGGLLILGALVVPGVLALTVSVSALAAYIASPFLLMLGTLYIGFARL
jgi:hypothetical protein